MIEYRLPEGLEETHFEDGGLWYKHQGRYLKSVGKILDTIYPMPVIDPWYLIRGKMVHKACCMIDNGNLDWQTLDSRLIPFCQAYQDFLETAHPVIELSEQIVVMPDYSYGGRLDRVFRLPNRERLIVTDIKVGSGKEPRYWLQDAAYACALAGDKANDYDLALLNLGKNGQPRLNLSLVPNEEIQSWRKILEDFLNAQGNNAATKPGREAAE